MPVRCTCGMVTPRTSCTVCAAPPKPAPPREWIRDVQGEIALGYDY